VADSVIARVQSLRDWFRGYEDNFVVIGGVACSLIMREYGADFRATRDIDMVLLLEALNVDFGRRFWDYVLEAGYKHCQKSTGAPQFYRFYEPISTAYPEMIELFSRRVDGLVLPDGAVVTPIPISEDISSLSAILLNDDYYRFLREGVKKINGLPVLDELYLIPFKAKAWLDLTERRNRGERIDRNDINKHRRDIYKLSDMVREGFKFALPETIERDMSTFLISVQEHLTNIPPKEREAEKLRLEKITVIFGLPVSILRWQVSLKTRMAEGKRKAEIHNSALRDDKPHRSETHEIG